jgi:uncharacterized protein YndB with AHSA1/START domain
VATSASLHASPDGDSIVSEIGIASPPERVFHALVDPQQVLQWWGQPGVYICTEFNADVRRGGKWRSAGTGPDGGRFEVTGEYLEVDPPRLLVHSWIASWTGDVETTVRWELEPKDGGTMLRVVHSGLAAHPGMSESYRGWPRILGWIQALLEKGETVAARKASQKIAAARVSKDRKTN